MNISKSATWFAELPFPVNEMRGKELVLKLADSTSKLARMRVCSKENKYSIELLTLEPGVTEHGVSCSIQSKLGFFTDLGLSLLRRHSHKSCGVPFEAIEQSPKDCDQL